MCLVDAEAAGRLSITTAGTTRVQAVPSGGPRSVEEPDDFEGYQQHQCKHHNQAEDAQAALPVAAVLQHVAHALGRRAQPAVGHINIFLHLFQQPRVQVHFFPYGEGDVLNGAGCVVVMRHGTAKQRREEQGRRRTGAAGAAQG
eukprot:GHRQ01033240.1.p1 GENE.GHRQ01033240.1~~GHRQ01033240.1.p1  ORF type:complete len:144 (-),score=31.71 GHRQ01033240.1:365-796(-)